MSPVETTLALVLLIGVVALMMRWFGRDDRVKPAASGEVDPVDALLAEVSGADPDHAGEVVAVSSDGWAFVPDQHSVVLMPHGHPLHGDPTARHGNVEDEHALHGPRAPGRLGAGDFAGARVRRGAPDHDPWRLEGVGRDGDYRAWFFETEEAARAALDLVERRVVRVPIDEDGDPDPLTDDDFEEARRLDEETERALDDGDSPEPML
jgi:hypothetical protein